MIRGLIIRKFLHKSVERTISLVSSASDRKTTDERLNIKERSTISVFLLWLINKHLLI